MTNGVSSMHKVDFVDMQLMAHMNYKRIMVYQDNLSKFSVLRPLTSKRTSEVAYQLMDVISVVWCTYSYSV